MISRKQNPKTHCLHCHRALTAAIKAELADLRVRGPYGFCSTACEFNYGVALRRGGKSLEDPLRLLLAKIVQGSEVVQAPGQVGELRELAKMGLITLHGKHGGKATSKGEISFIRSRTVRETSDESDPTLEWGEQDFEPDYDPNEYGEERRALQLVHERLNDSSWGDGWGC